MTDIPDERVIAFVDGQLDGDALLAFETLLASEPALAERVAAHRWMARQVTAAYGPPPQDKEDDGLIARLGLGDRPMRARPYIHPFTSRRIRVRVAAITALAAGIALAIIACPAVLTSTSTLVRVPNGPPTASGMLAASLSDQLAGEPGKVRIGESFRTQHGICRTFRSDHSVSGIGCREGDRWLVPIMTSEDPQAGAGPSTAYRLAGGDFPPAVMEEVDRRIKGDPLSVVDEEQLRQRGWR